MQSLIDSFLRKFKRAFYRVGKGEWTKIEIGRVGEAIAVDYLKREKGYRIIARNWVCKKDEIDIVAKEGEVVVFVEVRCRTRDSLVPVYYSVHERKKAALRRACKTFLRSMRSEVRHFRFDIVTVKFCQEGKNSVDHYTNVRLFSKNFHTLSDE